jgi:hypothetical protein
MGMKVLIKNRNNETTKLKQWQMKKEEGLRKLITIENQNLLVSFL